jgi:EmrB/QacA subfamily drug resistance transporter
MTRSAGDGTAPSVRFATARGRWILTAVVMGSGVVFLDGTVVNVALPAIGRSFHTGLDGLQWTVTAYSLTAGSLYLLGGSIGDIYGRRFGFVTGLAVFTTASLLCGVAPAAGFLIAARALQGVGGALLVPESLAIISATFHPDDRAQAIGAWSGLTGVSTAIGPFLGGFLVDAVSWRLVFLINLPFAAATIFIALRHVPETKNPGVVRHLDLTGATVGTLGLAGVVAALIEGPSLGFSSAGVASFGLGGLVLLIAFPFIERRQPDPLIPLGLFASRQFTAANVVTLLVYAALGGAMFFIVIELQTVMNYSALEAGAAFIPVTILMFFLSSRAGKLAQRIGPRIPMTVGPIVAAVGFLMLTGMGPGAVYLTSVLPGVIVFGLGLSLTVAPLTAAVLAAADPQHLGVASGLNNSVARIAGLLGVALLPIAAGFAGANSVGGTAFADGFQRVMWVTAALCAVGGVISLVTISGSIRLHVVSHPGPSQACDDPALIKQSGETDHQAS